MPDETGDNSLYLSDVSPEDKPWETLRAVAEKVEELYRHTDFAKYAQRISQCSRFLGFRFETQEDGSYRLKLEDVRFCRVRHCTVCQWRRSLVWRARFFTSIPRVIEDYPTARFIFLTLTVRNCPLTELRATVTQMNKAWERLSQRKQFPALGWVRALEVTRSKNGEAHPHLHCLLMVPPSYFSRNYIKQDEWTELWKHSLRADYTPVVNVKLVRNRRHKKGDRPDEGLNSDIVSGLLETLKYSVKPEDLVGGLSPADVVGNAQWLEELTRQLHKTRAISVGGVLKQYISEDEPTDEEMTHLEEEGVVLTEEDLRVWFGWREMVKRYAKVDRS